MTWLLRLLEQMSPQIVDEYQKGTSKMLSELYKKALETENKWDDWGVEMIAKILGVEIEKREL